MADDEVEVQEDGDIIVTLRLRRWEALRLCTILMAVQDRSSTSALEGAKWRGIASKLKTVATKSDARFMYRGKHRRPPSAYPNEIDMEMVLNGQMPYPVLSVKDMMTVWPRLEAKNLSAREIGDRLMVHPRTVVRWRREKKELLKGQRQ